MSEQRIRLVGSAVNDAVTVENACSVSKPRTAMIIPFFTFAFIVKTSFYVKLKWLPDIQIVEKSDSKNHNRTGTIHVLTKN